MERVSVTPLKRKNFIWTDEKPTLLLNVVHEYKIGKIPLGVDWAPNRAPNRAPNKVQRHKNWPCQKFPN